MNRITTFLKNLWQDESAEITVEYGLLTALVALGLVVVFFAFRNQVGNFFNAIGNRINNCPNQGITNC
jgi:Flp pilus assembly pilin Flp